MKILCGVPPKGLSLADNHALAPSFRIVSLNPRTSTLSEINMLISIMPLLKKYRRTFEFIIVRVSVRRAASNGMFIHIKKTLHTAAVKIPPLPGAFGSWGSGG